MPTTSPSHHPGQLGTDRPSTSSYAAAHRNQARAALERLLDDEETKAEAMDAIRSLIDHVDLQPLNDGGMAAELHGELAGIWAQSTEARLDGSKRASCVDVSQLTVVAGTRNPHNLTLSCSI